MTLDNVLNRAEDALDASMRTLAVGGLIATPLVVLITVGTSLGLDLVLWPFRVVLLLDCVVLAIAMAVSLLGWWVLILADVLLDW